MIMKSLLTNKIGVRELVRKRNGLFSAAKQLLAEIYISGVNLFK